QWPYGYIRASIVGSFAKASSLIGGLYYTANGVGRTLQEPLFCKALQQPHWPHSNLNMGQCSNHLTLNFQAAGALVH
ncbi:MAG: hypothetical protein VX332_09680, partial [Pseudomonadota bacterium]|nr:hypothetical protein [Pseudomonadota bacterium]